jgi:hypothetical protein
LGDEHPLDSDDQFGKAYDSFRESVRGGQLEDPNVYLNNDADLPCVAGANLADMVEQVKVKKEKRFHLLSCLSSRVLDILFVWYLVNMHSCVLFSLIRRRTRMKRTRKFSLLRKLKAFCRTNIINSSKQVTMDRFLKK